MLTPKEIEELRYASAHLLDDTIDLIYSDIIALIKKTGKLTDTAAYNLLLLSYLGENNTVIYKRISASLGTTDAALRRLIEDTTRKTYADDVKRITGNDVELGKRRLRRLTRGILKSCAGDIANLTKTMGFVVDGKFSSLSDVYRKVSGEAFKAVATGAMSYNEAVLKAAAPLISSGVKTINYETGAVMDVRAAIRRNVMSSIGELTNKISEQNFKDLGCDGWEISAHMACAPDHESIQGRQFTAKEWDRLDAGLKRHLGTLNCGHIKFPIIIGKSQPVYSESTLKAYKDKNKKGVTYDGQHYTTYEATQKQRAIENAIRKTREEMEHYISLGAAGEEKAKRLRLKSASLRRLYNDFCSKTGLTPQYNRLR